MFNHNGPPALWLVLSTDQLNVRTDENWEVSFAGSSWRNAALASAAKTPGRGNPVADGERTFDAAKKIWPLWILLIGIASGRRHSLARELEAVHVTVPGTSRPFFWFPPCGCFCFGTTRGFYHSMPALIRRNISNTSITSSNTGRFRRRLKAGRCISRRSTISWRASILSFCKLSINDPGSVVVLRALGCILRHRAVRSGVPDFAPPASGQNGSGGSPAGSFSTNAFVSDALCDERTSQPPRSRR